MTTAPPRSRRSRRPLTRSQTMGLSLGITTVIAVSCGPFAAGCLNRPIEPVEPRTTSTVVERIKQEGVDKIDLLLAIDNSSSMADKQQILADAVPDLVNRLVNPLCVDKSGNQQPTQPTDPTADCDKANGFDREFKPILDIHIGIVSSSLGGLGADQCQDAANHNNNDKGELVARVSGGGGDPTGGKGFLNWAPQKGGISDSATLTSEFTNMVTGVGQVGCGYEMQLESVYRFMVDPKPYASVAKDNAMDAFSNTTVSGVDQTILTQRADFLRPDSLVAIVLLSDENDCSTRTGSVDDGASAAGGQFYTVLNSAGFFKAASVCASDPGNACCYSCGLNPPSGCSADPVCMGSPRYDVNQGEDHVNLRCWHQKQRYGFDALYPTQRYVNAFSQFQIDPGQADLNVTAKGAKPQSNPLFQGSRGPDLVFFAGIVGVPWQVVANTDPNGTPDLKLGFQDFDTLTKNGFWEKYVGDPDTYAEPTEGIMKEDFNKRAGVAPAPSPTSPNGGERSIPTDKPDNLQYACIFPLKMEQPNGSDCVLPTDPADDPLCKPGDHTTQINAKAYPGLRELAVLHGLAGQGIPASICPANITDQNSSDYGYRPAVATIIDRLKEKLKGTCLPRKLNPDKDGNVPCVVIEASHQDLGQVDCKSIPGRQAVSDDHQPAVEAAKADPQAPMAPNDWNSFCEIIQLAGTDRDSCQNQEADQIPASVNGWCYVDAATVPPTGNPNLSDIASCPTNERRLVRFVNGGNVQSGATALITCSGEGAI